MPNHPVRINGKNQLNYELPVDEILDIAKSVKSSSALAAGNCNFQSLPLEFEPTEFSVICARGKRAYESPGNVWFRALIEQHAPQYANASNKMEKSIVVSTIVETVRKASPQGSFVRKVSGRWQEVSEGVARERVGQTFRDIIDAKYRSGTQAKRRRRAQAARSALTGTRRGSKGSDSDQSTVMEPRRKIPVKESMPSDLMDPRHEISANAEVPPQWLTQDVLTSNIFLDQQIGPTRFERSGLDDMKMEPSVSEQACGASVASRAPEKVGNMPGQAQGGLWHDSIPGKYGEETAVVQQWSQGIAHSAHAAPAAAASFESSMSSITGGSSLDVLANAINLFEQHPLIANSAPDGSNDSLNNVNNNNNNSFSRLMADSLEPAPAPSPDPYPFDPSDFSNYRAWFGEDGA